MILTICCADIGSITAKNFGWYSWSGSLSRSGWCGPIEANVQESGTDIRKFADHVVQRLKAHGKVALGFECPSWIPVPDAPSELGKARDGDKAVRNGKEVSLPWSAGAGAAVLATGLAQISWILDEVYKCSPGISAFLDWPMFREAQTGLFLWEAFVAGDAKAPKNGRRGHVGDAIRAVEAFAQAMPSVDMGTASFSGILAGEVRPRSSYAVKSRPKNTLSLIGAALLWAGWSSDVSLLHEPCLVIKPPPT